MPQPTIGIVQPLQQPHLDLGPMPLRAYQRRIAGECVGRHSIVVLPTGAGKTLIASEIIRRHTAPTLFLVPTRFLVPQQAAAIRNHTLLDVGEYFGGEKLPPSFDVLVSTPKAFQMIQGSGREGNLAWAEFSCVVFDEVHHILKDHPYRKLAQTLQQSGARTVRLGMTASLTYAVGDEKVKKSMNALCAELGIQHIATASKDELERDGYHAPGRAPDVRTDNSTPAGALSEADRRPHLMVPTFWSRVDSQKATPFSRSLVSVIVELEGAVNQALPSFKSPLRKSGVKAWGEFAHRAGVSIPIIGQLEPWYEALRILVVSWEEAEDAASTMLKMTGALDPQCNWGATALKEISKFTSRLPIKFPQFEKLTCALSEQLAKRGDSFRGIVFVQQRVMTHILQYVISTDPQLGSRLSPVCLYSTSTPATPSLAISKAQARDRLASFETGTSNLMITTAVAEEGMDIPEANCVIRYDQMHHAVSLVQGRGRARQADSDFIVLKERSDRTVGDLLKAEQQQANLGQSDSRLSTTRQYL